MTDARAYLLPDGQTYRHQKDRWWEELPVSKLEGRLKFYRSLHRKRPQFYASDVKALVMLKTKIGSSK